MQIKTTVRCHFVLAKMAVIKKTENSKCWRRNGEIRTLMRGWRGRKVVQPLGKELEEPPKVNHGSSPDTEM